MLAPYYRVLHPLPPHEVRAMTPSEIAATLGLDRTEEVQARPLILPGEPGYDPMLDPTSPEYRARPMPQPPRRVVVDASGQQHGIRGGEQP
jgi:hypothetical protein